jgi:CAAX prenyl protease-like protein
MVFLVLQQHVPLPQTAEFGFRIVILSAVIWYFSREVLDFGMSSPVLSILLGVAVCALWVAPDGLISGYRNLWPFNNSIVGSVHSSLDAGTRQDTLALVFRSIRAIIIVPIVEELFWRGWLMRWIINPDFRKVPLGTYSPRSFWIVALLFAAEHGPYWDVGLLTGIIYNYWMCRTKRLGDLIWVHAVTNAALCAYVVYTQKWEFWL